ncbi:unnamed protein product [Bemisia tabaci]|uniref:Protein tipE n=1 Tax=Bemisia tabaci TaxID=7038 RepID=A0A9P0AJ62_BEMTA|nr:unnamed protein product [Bemisia tabaci]
MRGSSSELLLDPQQELRKRKLLELAASSKGAKKQKRTCRQRAWFYSTSFLVMTSVSAGSSLLFLVPLYVDPAISTLVADFAPEPVTCTTVRREELLGIFNCSWSSCREGCTSDMYKCSHIYVAYTDHNDTRTEDAVLLVNIKGCGYPPEVKCANFTEDYGQEGAQFPCYYSRQNRTVVMAEYDRERQVRIIRHFFGLPFLVCFITSVALCIMHCRETGEGRKTAELQRHHTAWKQFISVCLYDGSLPPPASLALLHVLKRSLRLKVNSNSRSEKTSGKAQLL